MSRVKRNRDSASKMIEFVVLHIMAGVVFEAVSKDSIRFSVPRTCSRDNLVWKAEDIINSVKSEFVKSCFDDSEISKFSKEELDNIRNSINYIYTIRDEDFDANVSTAEMMSEIDNEIQSLKLNTASN